MNRQNIYLEKLKDPRWQKLRLEIFERDGWKCRNCGASDKPLHAHHLHYIYGLEPWEYEDEQSLLATLCEDCHAEETAELKDAKNRLMSVLADHGLLNSSLLDAFNSALDEAPAMNNEDARALILSIGQIMHSRLRYCVHGGKNILPGEEGHLWQRVLHGNI